MDYLNSLTDEKECRMRDLIFIHFPDMFVSFLYRGKKKKQSTMMHAYMRDPLAHKFVKHLISHSSTLLDPLVQILISEKKKHVRKVKVKERK